MIINLVAVARAMPIAALVLSACVSQSKYDELQAQNQQLQQQVTALQRETQFAD